MVGVTLGTGIGGGVILDGRVVRGASGSAGEIGHTTIDLNGRRCACGNYGCLEAYASGPNIAARAREGVEAGYESVLSELVEDDLERITAVTVYEALVLGDEYAHEVMLETAKILGRLAGDRIEALELPVSAHCNRVAVRDGHTECVSVGLEGPAEPGEVAEAMRAFAREFCDLGLPSAPPELIHVSDDPYRPQPKLDRALHDGMTTVVGRIRPDPVLENGMKLVLLSHNTKLGAAKGACLVAEYLVHAGLA